MTAVDLLVLRPLPLRRLRADPVEGGSANDYDYAYVKDPVNEFDLDGNGFCAAGHNPKKKGEKHGGCRGGGAARTVFGAGQATGRAVAKGAVAAGKDFGKCVIGQPCVIGTIGDYVVVNGALITMAGLGVFAGVASCATVIGCVAGGTLGFGGAGAAGYGLYAYNRAFWKEHG